MNSCIGRTGFICLLFALIFHLTGCGCTCVPRTTVAAPTEPALTVTPAAQNGSGCDIWTMGHGKRHVLLLHEITGISPQCLLVAKALAEAGCTVHMPRFFGRVPNHGTHYFDLSFHGFDVFNPHESGVEPRRRAEAAADWVIRQARKDDPQAQLVVVGNCLTGTIAFQLLARADVATAVVCQPALPFFSLHRAEALALPEHRIAATLRAMAETPGKRLISVNYRTDPVGTIGRQMELARRLAVAGLSDRHTVILGLSDASQPGDFHGSRVVRLRTASDRSHPTLTGRDREEADRFLAALVRELR